MARSFVVGAEPRPPLDVKSGGGFCVGYRGLPEGLTGKRARIWNGREYVECMIGRRMPGPIYWAATVARPSEKYAVLVTSANWGGLL